VVELIKDLKSRVEQHHLSGVATPNRATP